MNRKQMNNLIALYNLDLDYRIEKLTLEAQTNILINNIFQIINIDMKKDNITTYIVEYNDDIPSVLCYKILATLRSMLKFNLYLTNKPKKYKDYIDKNEVILSKRKLKQIAPEETIVISTYNPIYKVLGLSTYSNKYNLKEFKNWKLIENFTYKEIITALLFYHTDIDFEEYNEYFDLEKVDLNKDLTKISNLDYNYSKEIVFVKFGETKEYNLELLKDVEQEDRLVFYYITDEKQKEILESEYIYYVNRAINRPNSYNINSVAAALIVDKFDKIRFVGNWSDKDIKELEEFYDGFCC